MLQYAITFFVVALIAGVFGFWGVPGVGLATEIGKILCVVFAVLMVITFLRSRSPRV